MRKLLFMALLVPVIALSQEKLSIAVMELDGAGVTTADLQGLSDQLRTELFRAGKYSVIERSRMNEILKEQGFQKTGCTNTECAVEIGQLIGVRKIVVGSINKVGTIYTASIRMVDVSTGKIDKIASEHCEDCSINNVLLITIHNVARVLVGLEADKVIEKKEITLQSTRPLESNSTDLNIEGVSEWEKLEMSKKEWVKYKKSGLNFNDWVTLKSIKNKKIATVVVNASLGYPALAGGVFCLIAGFYQKSLSGHYDSNARYLHIASAITSSASLLINIPCHIWYSKNKKLEKQIIKKENNKLSISPIYDFINNQAGLSLNYNF